MTFDPHDLEDKLSQLDVCFVIDTTGSMQWFIDAARDHIRKNVEEIAKRGALDVQFALVEYRDHPPQDTTFVQRAYPFADGATFEHRLAGLVAAGGGDGPEAVWDGLVAAGNLQWRPTADHQCFLVGDSPPHGYGFGDSWPKGCPCKMTAGGIIELFQMQNIVLNAVNISGDEFTTKAFTEVAEACGGKCEVVENATAAVASTIGTTRVTGDTVGVARGYAMTMSSTPGMTDAAYAASTATPMGEVKKMRGYLKKRRIDVTSADPKDLEG